MRLSRILMTIAVAVTGVLVLDTPNANAQLFRRQCDPCGQNPGLLSRCMPQRNNRGFFQRRIENRDCCICVPVQTSDNCSDYKCTIEYIGGQWVVTTYCPYPGQCYCQVPIVDDPVHDESKRAPCAVNPPVNPLRFRIQLEETESGSTPQCFYFELVDDSHPDRFNMDPFVVNTDDNGSWQIDISYDVDWELREPTVGIIVPIPPIEAQVTLVAHGLNSSNDTVIDFSRANSERTVLLHYFAVKITRNFPPMRQ